MNRNKEIDKKRSNKNCSNAKPYNGKKPNNRKPKEIKGKGSSHDVSEEIVNNPNWYFINPELKAQAMQLSMQYIAGSGALVGSYVPETAMIIPMNPAPGVTFDQTGEVDTDPESGFNLSCFKLYTRLSMKTGRSTSAYAPSDVGTLILAIGELLAIEEHIRRYFGIAFTYNERNRTFPRIMLQRLGLNATDFFEHYADYRMRFNTLITRINQIPIPMNIPYLEKCLELYQRVFLDSDTPLAQVFAYVPATTWELNETAYEHGSILETKPAVCEIDAAPTIQFRTMAWWLSRLESMAQELLGSSTLNVIYADLMNLATYENTPFFKFDYLSEGYLVIPTFNKEALMQLQHMTFLGLPTSLTDKSKSVWNTPLNDVYPDANKAKIIYNPVFGENRKFAYDVLANFDVANPTDDEKLEALRFTAIGSGATVTIDNVAYAHNMILPDHYCITAIIFAGISTGAVNGAEWFTSWMPYTQWEGTTHWIKHLSVFEKHPFAYVVDPADRSKIISVDGDLDFVTKVPADYIKRINKLIAMTLFDVQFK